MLHRMKKIKIAIADDYKIYRDGLKVGLLSDEQLEVVLEENEPIEAGVREAYQLLARLGIERSQLIEGGYVDLLGDRRET